MSDEQPREASSSHAWAWGLFTVLVVYLLLPGPVVYLVEHKVLSESGPTVKLLEKIFVPLGYMVDHVKPVEKLYKSYFRLWGVEIF